MKKLIVMLVFCVAASSGFAVTVNVDDVYWYGGTGLWMDTSNWTETSGTSNTSVSYWYVPGMIAEHPDNDGSWVSNTNKGRAIIAGGTAQVTSASRPDGRVERLYVEGTSGAALDTSANLSVYRYYVGETSGTTGSVSQATGAVTVSYFTMGTSGTGTYTQDAGTFTTTYATIGNYGTGTYNMKGGSASLATTDYLYIAAQAGSVGTFNQTGGDVTTFRVKIGSNDNAVGLYEISGGTLSVTGYFAMYYDSTLKVSGSDATSIRFSQLNICRTAGNGVTLAVELDENGSTLIEAYGVSGVDTYTGAYLGNAILSVDTLAGFDGVVGSVYDILWSATTIDTTGGLIFSNLSETQFSWAVIDDAVRGGQTLQLTVIPEPATIALLTIGGLLFVRKK